MDNHLPVLDKGFVRLVDMMGDDQAVVQAARVSYAQGIKGEERDRKLIFYLLRNDHGTPFEMVVYKFHVKCPIFVMRQWIRHRMASYNEVSGRYVELPDEFYVPETFRTQDKKNKQASVQAELEHSSLRAKLEESYKTLYRAYKELLEQGVAREMARMVLPLAIYTEFYWTINARSLMNFIRLRRDEHAQWEIQQYGEALLSIMKMQTPIITSAFEESLSPNLA